MTILGIIVLTGFIFGAILVLDIRDRRQVTPMPTSRARKNKGKTNNQVQRQRPQELWWKRHWKAVVAIAGPIAATIGFASAVATFLPHLIVEPGGQFDPSSPYPLPFTIRNTGAIPVTDVQATIGVCRMLFNMPPRDLPENECKGHLKDEIYIGNWSAKQLAPDETYTLRLDEAGGFRPGLRLSAADLSIEIHFYPWFLKVWPFYRYKEFRFQTKLEVDGKFSWKARPVEK